MRYLAEPVDTGRSPERGNGQMSLQANKQCTISSFAAFEKREIRPLPGRGLAVEVGHFRGAATWECWEIRD